MRAYRDKWRSWRPEEAARERQEIEVGVEECRAAMEKGRCRRKADVQFGRDGDEETAVALEMARVEIRERHKGVSGTRGGTKGISASKPHGSRAPETIVGSESASM